TATVAPSAVPTAPTATVAPTAAPTATVAPTVAPTATASPIVGPTVAPTAAPTPVVSATPGLQMIASGECADMEKGGPYANVGNENELGFRAMVLYANGDYCSTSYTFTGTNKKYRMVVKGASDNSTTAGVSVYIGGEKVGEVSFTGTSLSEQSFDFEMTDVTGTQEIKFLLETDNNTNNTYINSYELYYLGDISAPTATPTATTGPIVGPTVAPTAAPTATATVAPTAKPTATATVAPTADPTPVVSAKPTATPEPQKIASGDCADMEKGGSYAGVSDKLGFSAMVLYGNGDSCSTSYTFTGTNKKYRMFVKGASSNETTASVSVYIGDQKVGAVSFTGTALSTQSFDFKMTDVTGKQTIKFLLENDNGSNDIYINSYELYYIGDIPEPPAAPVPATKGAAYTGNYRNLFKEYGYSEAEINEKVESTWQQLFYGTDEQRIYYPVGDDMAYIYTADTDDVRSEGMSYGMMICVQMDKQEEFNRLWKWAKTYMQHTEGDYKGYFAWKMHTDGSKMDNVPASDGEEYFATALLFASARWGDGKGIYDYNAEAQSILDTMLHQADDGHGENMFNSTHKMPVFCPIGNAASFTDPSYHLPAFYEVWAIEAEKDNEFWSEAAEASRQHFKDATHETTGLGPDYSEYTGAPRNEGGGHDDFRYDAWRIAGNIACDYAWWAKDDWAVTHANRLQSFFYDKGVESYGSLWTIDGTTERNSDHSPGLVAMNATASLAASTQKAWAFVENFWNTSPTTGKYRYYDGCLYMMGLLHCSGNFRIYLSGNTPTAEVNGKISPTSAEFDLSGEKQKDVTTNLILAGERSLVSIKNGDDTLNKGTDYTVSNELVTIKKEYLANMSTGNVKLTFVFDQGKNATLTISVKNTETGAGNDPSGKISAVSANSSNDVTVEDGKVTFNSTDSYIAFDVDLGSEELQKVTAYVKEPNNGGQLLVRSGSLSNTVATIYNLGNGNWTEVSNTTWPKPTGTTTLYIQTNKPGLQIDWIKFE
ncbi:MAG: glycosyl hydrolase family 8, partial [Clostridiales bacterium]|nr:glycosyl hydrolase family 8 [Clostridiales bacterium]